MVCSLTHPEGSRGRWAQRGTLELECIKTTRLGDDFLSNSRASPPAEPRARGEAARDL